MKWIGIQRAAALALLAALALAGSGCSKTSKVAGHIQRGSDYMAKGDYLKAEIEYLNALRLDPANVPVARQLGEIYFQQGNIPKAFIFFKRAEDSGQADEDLRIKIGRAHV